MWKKAKNARICWIFGHSQKGEWDVRQGGSQAKENLSLEK